MIDLSGTVFLWVKALHVISVIAWMAGLLYLPRLFVYHVDAEAGSAQSEIFKVMERRLLRAIMTPAMAGAFVFGGLLLANLDAAEWTSGWLIVKLAAVLGLGALHGQMGHWRRDFENDTNRRSAKFYRYANEAPTILMVIIVIMAVVRPF